MLTAAGLATLEGLADAPAGLALAAADPAGGETAGDAAGAVVVAADVAGGAAVVGGGGALGAHAAASRPNPARSAVRRAIGVRDIS